MSSHVTIIIPTFDRAAQVTHAIDSALDQTYESLDIIVIDDGSTDDTPDVLRRYDGDPRLRVVRLERNVGVTAAKNAGLDRLTVESDLFGILDSDCRLVPDAIERLATAFDADATRYSQVLGWSVDADSDEVAGSMSHREGPVTYDDALSGRFSGEFFHLAACAMLDGARFDARAAGAEASLWWPLLRRKDGWLIPAVVHRYDTTGTDRVSAIDHSAAQARGRMWACRAIQAAVGTDLRERYPRRYGESLVELAKWSALAADRRAARVASREGVRYARSLRSIVMAVVILLPTQVLRAILENRSRVDGASS